MKTNLAAVVTGDTSRGRTQFKTNCLCYRKWRSFFCFVLTNRLQYSPKRTDHTLIITSKLLQRLGAPRGAGLSWKMVKRRRREFIITTPILSNQLTNRLQYSPKRTEHTLTITSKLLQRLGAPRGAGLSWKNCETPPKRIRNNYAKTQQSWKFNVWKMWNWKYSMKCAKKKRLTGLLWTC